MSKNIELSLNNGALKITVVAFEWHSMVVNGHMIYGVRVPADQVWSAIEGFHAAPGKAIDSNGKFFWVMNSFYDRKTGKCVRLEAGNASPFTICEREV